MSRLKFKHVMIILLAFVAARGLKSSLLDLKPKSFDVSQETEDLGVNPGQLIVEQVTSEKSAEENTLQPSLLPEILKRQTQLLALSTEDPEEIEAQAKKIVQGMSTQELLALSESALNENKNQDERLAAVFLLMCAEERGQEYLEKIFFAPTDKLSWNAKPHSAAEADKNFELNLRVMALQGIEKNLLSKKEPSSILSSQLTKSSYLNSLVSIVLKGQKLQQPLLQRFIEESLRGASI